MSSGIKKIFSEISGSYELINHIFTFGLDIFWRKKAVKLASSGNSKKFLDVCTGTGEIAILIANLPHRKTTVYATDFSESMLKIASAKPKSDRVQFVKAECNNLPFPDQFFDCVIASFGARNLNISKNHLLASLQEINRVLKTGGKFVNLETSQPDHKIFRFLFHIYLRFFVVPIGRMISGSRHAYKYLINSIIKFYSKEEFRKIILKAGFSNVTYKNLLNGVAAIHVALK